MGLEQGRSLCKAMITLLPPLFSTAQVGIYIWNGALICHLYSSKVRESHPAQDSEVKYRWLSIFRSSRDRYKTSRDRSSSHRESPVWVAGDFWIPILFYSIWMRKLGNVYCLKWIHKFMGVLVIGISFWWIYNLTTCLDSNAITTTSWLKNMSWRLIDFSDEQAFDSAIVIKLSTHHFIWVDRSL